MLITLWDDSEFNTGYEFIIDQFTNSLSFTKTTKGTTRVPEISHLRAGNHSKSMEKEKEKHRSRMLTLHSCGVVIMDLLVDRCCFSFSIFIIVYESIKSEGRENEWDFSLSRSSTCSKNTWHLGMFWLLCSALVVNSASIKTKIKKFYLGLSRFFCLKIGDFCVLLGILLSINPVHKLRTRKCFDYNFPILQ